MSDPVPGVRPRARKMYLDIDGVLVVWDRTHNCTELARGFGRLMRFCKLHQIQPYWLTLWSREPATLAGVSCLLWPKTCPTQAIPEILCFDPAAGKASAIDFASDFVWIEDGIGENDIRTLQDRDALDRFFWTDGTDPDCLLKFMAFTRHKLNLPEFADWGPAWDSFFSRPRQPMSPYPMA